MIWQGSFGKITMPDGKELTINRWHVVPRFPQAEPGRRAKRNYRRLSQQAANNNLDYPSNPFASTMSMYRGIQEEFFPQGHIEVVWEGRPATEEEIEDFGTALQAGHLLDRLSEVSEADGDPESDG